MINRAVFEGEGAHAGGFAGVVGVVGAAHLGEHGGAAVRIFRWFIGRFAAVVVFDAFAFLLLGE